MSEKILEETLSNTLEKVKNEVIYIATKHNGFNSPHEGYAVMLEELDELWDEIKKKPSSRDSKYMKNECKQIAAAAICFMLYCC
jgi:NTP pyrophosphatase (non-canonical NTP hydrolase)